MVNKNFNLSHIVWFKILLVFLLTISCDESPTEQEKIKDPREYVWSMDTLKYKDPTLVQSLLSSIWGSSEKDVYVTGHADVGNPIFHFNGNSWEEIDESSNWIKPSFDPYYVLGFAANDVWFVGTSQLRLNNKSFRAATFYYYNGDRWKLFELPIENELYHLWGKSSKDLWACGPNGVVVHFDGTNFTTDTIKIFDQYQENLMIRGVVKYQNNIFALGYKNEFHTNYFFKKENNDWIISDSYVIGSSIDKGGDYGFYLSNENRLFSYGYGGIWEFVNNFWLKIVEAGSSYTVNDMVEYEKDNFLIIKPYAKLFHYTNGKEELIKDFGNNIRFYSIWANKKECFIVANKGGSGIFSKTIIYHGK
jgi:hypothetical protein